MYYTDASFPSNWAGLKAAGLGRVAYHYGSPSLPVATSAAAEADRFVDIVKPQPGDVLCLDLEASRLSESQTNAWAKAFGLRLRERAPGVATWLYCGGYSRNNSGAGLSAFFDFWWYPRYATTSPVTSWPSSATPTLSGNTTGWPAPHVWQWAESLHTSEGLVDASVSALPATQLRTPTNPTEADLPLNDADKAWIASAIATSAIAAAQQTWTRYKLHGPAGDLSLQEALSEILQQIHAGGAAPTKASGTATVTVNLTPEA
jgi:hypothetical protein